MNAFNLPKAHTLRATWVPLHFYPVLGSTDCITVAIVAIDSHGECKVIKSENLKRLVCFFGESGADLIRFIDLAVDTVSDELNRLGSAVFNKPIELGSSFSFGNPTPGSGFSLDAIAKSWLNKISMLQHGASASEGAATSVAVISDRLVTTIAPVREKRIVPAVRDAIREIAPKFTPYFDKEFQFKNRKVPVRLNYSGEHLVAGFDRVSPKNIEGSLEKVRSKLWVLAEHRDQTRHEAPRLHEMLVVPTTVQDRIVDSSEMRIVDEACDDIEKEADRREIRLRRFQSTRDLAAHIYRVESRPQPLSIN